MHTRWRVLFILLLCASVGAGLFAWRLNSSLEDNNQCLRRAVSTLLFRENLFESGSFHSSRPDLDETSNRMFSSTLHAMGEPSFDDLPQPDTIARLFVDGTYMSPFAFRLVERQDGFDLIFKMAQMNADGCSLELAEERRIPLSPQVGHRLAERFHQLEICRIRPSGHTVFGGANWIFEQIDPERPPYGVCVGFQDTPQDSRTQDILRELATHVPDIEVFIRLYVLGDRPEDI